MIESLEGLNDEDKGSSVQYFTARRPTKGTDSVSAPRQGMRGEGSGGQYDAEEAAWRR